MPAKTQAIQIGDNALRFAEFVLFCYHIIPEKLRTRTTFLISDILFSCSGNKYNSKELLPLVSLIGKLFELLNGLESKPEVYLIMRHCAIQS
jgi:hypothetical protein